jgi:hypothetical protein
MARWTNWRLIAERKYWYSEEFDWDGPACYELAIVGPRGGNLKIVYIGETSNEKKRMTAYGSIGSHLKKIINWHLKEGWHLYYRARSAKSKADAVAMQNNLLARYEYDWNIQLNR